MGWLVTSTPLEELSRDFEDISTPKQVMFIELMHKVEDLYDQSIRQLVEAIQDCPRIISTLACPF